MCSDCNSNCGCGGSRSGCSGGTRSSCGCNSSRNSGCGCNWPGLLNLFDWFSGCNSCNCCWFDAYYASLYGLCGNSSDHGSSYGTWRSSGCDCCGRTRGCG